MSAITRCRRVNSWLAYKRLFQALPGRAGGAVVETTVDHTLMRGSKPHDRGYVAELPRSRNLRRIGDPADSGCEGSPDRDRAPGTEIKIDGEDFVVAKESDIMGVVEETV